MPVRTQAEREEQEARWRFDASDEAGARRSLARMSDSWKKAAPKKAARSPLERAGGDFASGFDLESAPRKQTASAVMNARSRGQRLSRVKRRHSAFIDGPIRTHPCVGRGRTDPQPSPDFLKGIRKELFPIDRGEPRRAASIAIGREGALCHLGFPGSQCARDDDEIDPSVSCLRRAEGEKSELSEHIPLVVGHRVP